MLAHCLALLTCCHVTFPSLKCAAQLPCPSCQNFVCTVPSWTPRCWALQQLLPLNSADTFLLPQGKSEPRNSCFPQPICIMVMILFTGVEGLALFCNMNSVRAMSPPCFLTPSLRQLMHLPPGCWTLASVSVPESNGTEVVSVALSKVTWPVLGPGET